MLPTPDPNVFYCSYTGAQLYVTTDHGHTFSEISPGLTKAQFLSPAAIDPTNRNHLVAAANDIGGLWLFHHKPGRSDEELVRIRADARRIFSATETASEGEALQL